MDKETQKNLLDLVKRNYEEIAEDFDMTRKKALWPELVKLAEMVKEGDRVLDVGCGNGRLAGALSDKNIYYLGVDGSYKLIESAKKQWSSGISNFQFPISKQFSNPNGQTNAKYKIQNAKFMVADILELDKLPENNFDYVFCVAVLHHLPGADLRVEALRQMKKKLAPGGKIVLTVWNLWSRPKFKKLIFKYGLMKLAGRHNMDFGDILFDWKNNQGENLSRRYYHAFIKAEFLKTAEKAGLMPEKFYCDKYNYYLILHKPPILV